MLLKIRKKAFQLVQGGQGCVKNMSLSFYVDHHDNILQVIV
jgi:hypothetical protein